jgi:hypothetical protein
MKNEPQSVRLLIAATTLLLSLFNATMSFGQTTCTISGSGIKIWNGNSPPTCIEGGNAVGKDILVVPVGMTLVFDTSNDTWTGTRMDIYGTVEITFNGTVTLHASVIVKDNATLNINSKLQLGDNASPSPCPYTLLLETSTSKLDILGDTPDRLRICGNEIARGGTAGCNPFPAGPIPFCEPDAPTSHFPGPVSFNSGGIGGPLPVELLFFKAYASNRGVDLKWATASEKGAHYFAIEKSLNGKDFTEIGRVDASGNTIARMDYSFFDDNALLGRNYYRLKEVDFDGTYEYFNITFADTDGTKAVSLYPNPVQNSRIQFKLNFASDEQSYAKIYNSTGALVSSFSFSGTHYNEESNLRTGAYVLKVSVGNELFTQRFVIP